MTVKVVCTQHSSCVSMTNIYIMVFEYYLLSFFVRLTLKHRHLSILLRTLLSVWYTVNFRTVNGNHREISQIFESGVTVIPLPRVRDLS